MSVEEYESLGARFFGLIFKDATVSSRRAEKGGGAWPALRHALGISAGGGEGGGDWSTRRWLFAQSAWQSRSRAPIVLMSSGENVVTVGAESGVGGRNQEYCTAAAGERSRAAGGSSSVRSTPTGTDGPGRLPVPRRAGLPRRSITDGETAQAAEAGRDRSGGRAAHARHVGAALAARLRRGGGSKCLRARSARDFDSGIKEIQKE